MVPSERLKPVRRVAETRERNAAKMFGDAQRILKDQESKLEQLKIFRKEYRDRFESAMRTGMSAMQLQEFQSFLSKLEKAIDQQQAIVEDSRQDSSAKKSAWQKKHTRTQAIGKAIERFQKVEVCAEEKKDQKESDEFGLRGGRRKD